MHGDNMDLPKIPDIVLGKVIPDNVRIKQMERELEESRYEELENRIRNIEEHSKSQVKLAEDEISFLKQQLEFALQRAENAEAGEKKATRIAIISVTATILSFLINVAMFIVSLINA